MSILHEVIARLPFEWAQYAFMRNALVAILVASPLFALMGTLVVNNRMAFFSDAIGHASLAGLGIGVLVGMADPLWALLAFALALGIAILVLQRFTRAAMDAVISLCMCFAVALGVVLLSRGGNFNRFGGYLVGDLLSITPREIGLLCLTGVLAGGGLLLGYNRILLIGFNESLARSRGWNCWGTQVIFSATIALVVTMNLSWVGLLLVNSLLILPAAGAQNLAGSVRQYVLWATGISLISGVTGLIASFYANVATGASIVLVAMACYGATLGWRLWRNRRGAVRSSRLTIPESGRGPRSS